MSLKTKIAVASAGVIAATTVVAPMAQAVTLYPPKNGECRVAYTAQELSQLQAFAVKFAEIDESLTVEEVKNGLNSPVVAVGSYYGLHSFDLTPGFNSDADSAVRAGDKDAFKKALAVELKKLETMLAALEAYSADLTPADRRELKQYKGMIKVLSDPRFAELFFAQSRLSYLCTSDLKTPVNLSLDLSATGASNNFSGTGQNGNGDQTGVAGQGGNGDQKGVGGQKDKSADGSSAGGAVGIIAAVVAVLGLGAFFLQNMSNIPGLSLPKLPF